MKITVDTVDWGTNILYNQRVTEPGYEKILWIMLHCILDTLANFTKKFTNLGFDLGPPPRGGWYPIKGYATSAKGTLSRKGGSFHNVEWHLTM
jgi:hypothetical protein